MADLEASGFSSTKSTSVLEAPEPDANRQAGLRHPMEAHQDRVTEQIVGIKRAIQKMTPPGPAGNCVRWRDVKGLGDHRFTQLCKQFCVRELWRRFDSKSLPRRSS